MKYREELTSEGGTKYGTRNLSKKRQSFSPFFEHSLQEISTTKILRTTYIIFLFSYYLTVNRQFVVSFVHQLYQLRRFQIRIVLFKFCFVIEHEYGSPAWTSFSWTFLEEVRMLALSFTSQIWKCNSTLTFLEPLTDEFRLRFLFLSVQFDGGSHFRIFISSSRRSSGTLCR